MEDKIKEMYTFYPYPEYDESMDKHVPIPCEYSPFIFLELIRHYLYNGYKIFDNFRVLVAGCGIGGDVIALGYLLKEYKNSEIFCIDLSKESIEVTKTRVELYNLKNISISEMSLLDLDKKKHGSFDFILSIGVLHHLQDPIKGLSILKSVLKEDGGMYLMVYGKIGRMGVYQMQDMLKIINRNTITWDGKIDNYKIVYDNLPKKNWFKKGEDIIIDHKASDSGIVDLLLNVQDRAYTVRELYKYINGVGMNIVELSPCERYKYKNKIVGLDYTQCGINEMDSYCINELYYGDICKHSFYISKQRNTKALLTDLDNIMILNFIFKNQLDQIIEYFCKNEYLGNLTINGLKLSYKLPKTKYIWNYNKELIGITFKMTNNISYILKNIDNNTSTIKIFDNLRCDLNVKHTNDYLLREFFPVYNLFELYDFILLRK